MSITNYDMSEIDTWNIYKESYIFMMKHPIVKQIKKENKKLKKEVAHLKTMLAITQENMRLLLECNHTKKFKKSKPLYTTTLDSEDVVDVVDLDKMPEQPNIRYEIIENYAGDKKMKEEMVVEGEDEEEVVEEAEEEEEEEVVVEKAEEEEVVEEAEEEEEVVVEGEEEEEVVEEAEAEEEEEEVVEKAEEEEEVVEKAEEEEEVVEEAEEEEVVEGESEEEEVETVVKDETVQKVQLDIPSAEESDEEEVFEIIIDGKTYYTNDREWGAIYDVDDNGEINMEVGKFSNGVVKFY